RSAGLADQGIVGLPRDRRSRDLAGGGIFDAHPDAGIATANGRRVHAEESPPLENQLKLVRLEFGLLRRPDDLHKSRRIMGSDRDSPLTRSTQLNKPEDGASARFGRPSIMA